jgi:hypothetical protein
LLTDPAQTDDTHLLDLADQALRALAHRFTTAQDPASAVREVLRTVFGSADVSHDLDRRPLDAPDYEQHLVRLLADSGRIDLVVTAVRQALRDSGSTATAGREEGASPAPHERRNLPAPRRPIRGRRLPIVGPRHSPC